MTKSSDRALAQAFRAWADRARAGNGHGVFKDAATFIEQHAAEIDAAAPEGAQAVALSLSDADEIAKVCAHKHGKDHAYVREAGLDFEPHLWVVEAVRAGFAYARVTAPPSQDAEDAAKDREDAEKWRALNRPWVSTPRPPRADGACSRCGNCRRGDFANCKNRQYFDAARAAEGDGHG